MSEDVGSPAVRAEKSRWRREAKARIGSMHAAERSAADAEICAGLARLADEQGVSTVLAYLSLADEVNVDGFLAAMVERGRETVLPRVVGGDHLRYGLWRPCSRLSRDALGVLAPESASLDAWRSGWTIVVVPGRVFDVSGGRVGRGGGYYDRILAARPEQCLVVGAAYECQVVEDVPRERHDRNVDCLITQGGCRRFRHADSR